MVKSCQFVQDFGNTQAFSSLCPLNEQLNDDQASIYEWSVSCTNKFSQ